MQECQRSYRRLDFDARVLLKIDNGSSRIVRGCLKDISMGGFRILSKEKMELNKEVDTMMTLSSLPILDRPLSCKSRVKHVASTNLHGVDFFSMGLEFTNVNKTKIKGLIRKVLDWRRGSSLPQQYRREALILLRLLPLIIVITWAMSGPIEDYSFYRAREQGYEEEVRKGLVYFLYHS